MGIDRRLRGLALIGLAGVLTALCTGCAVTLDERRAFHPRQDGAAAAEVKDLTIRYGETFVKTKVEHGFIDSGAGRIAYTFARRDAGRPLFVYCGGREFLRKRHASYYISKLVSAGFGDMLLFDYPGYGDSGGAATVEDFRAAIGAVIEAARARLGPDQKLILWGYSLGAFACAEVAKDPEVDALVLEAAAVDAGVFAVTGPPRWLRPFVRVRIASNLAAFDNAAALSDYGRPILALAGGDDRLVPPAAAEELAAKLRADGADIVFHLFPEATHTRIWAEKKFPDTVKRFIDAKLPGVYPPGRLRGRRIGPPA